MLGYMHTGIADGWTSVDKRHLASLSVNDAKQFIYEMFTEFGRIGQYEYDDLLEYIDNR